MRRSALVHTPLTDGKSVEVQILRIPANRLNRADVVAVEPLRVCHQVVPEWGECKCVTRLERRTCFVIGSTGGEQRLGRFRYTAVLLNVVYSERWRSGIVKTMMELRITDRRD